MDFDAWPFKMVVDEDDSIEMSEEDVIYAFNVAIMNATDIKVITALDMAKKRLKEKLQRLAKVKCQDGLKTQWIIFAQCADRIKEVPITAVQHGTAINVGRS